MKVSMKGARANAKNKSIGVGAFDLTHTTLYVLNWSNTHKVKIIEIKERKKNNQNGIFKDQ